MESTDSRDPFAELELLAKRQEAEEKATRLISGARTKLVLGADPRSAFFATLALRLNVVCEWEKTETMATDGHTLFVNPDWSNALTADERVGVVAHETLHCVFKHQCRREGRDPKKWNEACDLSANQILLGAGFVLPKSRLMPGEGKYKDFPKEKSAEEYYTLLSTPPKGGQGEQESSQGEENGDGEGEGNGGQPSADPGGCGQILDAKDPADAADQEADWDVATAQAERASQSRGELPAGLARLVKEVLRPAADWKDVLREFVSANAKNDFSWARPNRRFISQGLYLPGLHSQELGEVVIAVDTSGSVGEAELAVFGSEIEAILGSFKCSAKIVYHDAAVTKVDEWQSSDGPLVLDPLGGGGTDHRPVFDWVDKQDAPPVCLIALTDAYSVFPNAAPDYPVLWALIGENQATLPFGRVIKVKP